MTEAQTEAQTKPKTDASDMMAVHQVLRDAITNAPVLIGGAKHGDIQRAAVVGSYYDNVLRFLQVHHHAEDELVWPKLLERAPARTELVQGMVADHERIHQGLDRATAALPRWASSGDTGAAGELTTAIDELGSALIPHLDREEREIVPVISDHLSEEEWGEMPGHALRAFDGDKVWLILGLIRENMTQAQRDAMLAHMPPPPRDMWINMGNAAFDEFIAEVRRH